MQTPLVFILTAEESFTPERSGAIATHTHGCCAEATAAGIDTVVLGRPHARAHPYEDVETILYEAPEPPTGGAALLIRRAERRVRSWTRLRFGEYADRTASVITKRGLTHATLIVHNDPELVVALRKRLPHALLLHWFHNQHTCKSRTRAQFAGCVDHVIAVSDFVSDWVCEHYGLDTNAVERIYNGVDLEMFTPLEDSCDDSMPVINFTGRTGIEKAPDLVLSAALEMARRGKARPFGVQLIGSNHWGERTMDEYQARLDTLATALGDTGIAVEMTGHLGRRETARRMQTADIHVVPSRWEEPFGLTTIEGMACGLATVASRTGATPEILRDDAGLLFDNEDVAGLADHLEALVADPDLRRSYAERARVRAQEYSWSNTWRGLEKLLSRIE